MDYDGTESENAGYVISPFVDIIGGHNINFRPHAPGWSGYLIEYDSSKQRIDHWGINGDFLGGRTIGTHSNAVYVKFCVPILYLRLLRIYDVSEDKVLFEFK